MGVRGIHFAVFICFFAAFIGGYGEVQNVNFVKSPNISVENVNEDNTNVLTEPKPNSPQTNTTFGIESSTINTAGDTRNTTANVNNDRGVESSTKNSLSVVGINATVAGINNTHEIESSTIKSSSDGVKDNATKPILNQPETTDVPKTISVSGQKKKTKILDPISVKIFRAEENGIWLSDMTFNKQIAFKNISHMKTFSIDYHYGKRLIFYAANDTIIRDQVFGSKMTTESSSLIVMHGVDGPLSLAVDWIHDKLYWYSNRHSSVECSGLDGSNRTLLIDSLINTEYPSNIALDPYEGFIFIVSNYSIYRANLDGSELTDIQLQVNSPPSMSAVRSLAVDTHNKKLYYSGKMGHFKKGQPYLATCNYRGENVKEIPIVHEAWNDIFSIAVLRDTLYFAHYPKSEPDALWSIDLSESPLNPVKINSTDGGLWSIKIYHPKVQRRSAGVN